MSKNVIRASMEASEILDMIYEETTIKNPNAVTPLEKMMERKKLDPLEKKYKDYMWGFGLEHETQVVSPYESKHGIILLNTIEMIIQKLEKQSMTNELRKYLENLKFGAEKTGRKCGGKYVIKPPPVLMPEFITGKPFNTVYQTQYDLNRYAEDIMAKELKFIGSLLKTPGRNNKNAPYPLFYPFGMFNRFRVMNDKGKIEEKNYKDYTGSYHVTITLPFKHKEDGKYNLKEINDFYNMHQDLANRFQWIEPLLCASFFSVDFDFITKKKAPKGSFRVMMTGWGNFAGTDVRKLNEGIGRYSNIRSYWRKGLEFNGTEKLMKYCDESSHPDEPKSISRLSSDIRTFGEDNTGERVSGAPLKIPNGLEFRIFDNFSSTYLDDLVKIFIFLAEATRVGKRVNMFVYEDKDWIESLQNIMKKGWKAPVTEGYLNKLRQIFEVKLKMKTKTPCAYYVFNILMKDLMEKHMKGDWVKLLLRKDKQRVTQIPNINRKSTSFAIGCYFKEDAKRMKQLEQFYIEIKGKTKPEVEEFAKNNFNENISSDIFYFFIDCGVITSKDNNIVLKVKKDKISESIGEFMASCFFPLDIRSEFNKLTTQESRAFTERANSII